jgi:hypothetical protein
MREIHPLAGSGYDPAGDVSELEPGWSDSGVMVGNTRLAAETVDPSKPSTWGAVGRNAACPCGSGKKYKYCHGRIA